MHSAIERYRTHPSHRSSVPMHVQLLEYVEDVAGMLGMRLHIWRYLGAAPRWFLGPFSAAHYRLDGLGGSHRIELIQEERIERTPMADQMVDSRAYP